MLSFSCVAQKKLIHVNGKHYINAYPHKIHAYAFVWVGVCVRARALVAS